METRKFLYENSFHFPNVRVTPSTENLTPPEKYMYGLMCVLFGSAEMRIWLNQLYLVWMRLLTITAEGSLDKYMRHAYPYKQPPSPTPFLCASVHTQPHTHITNNKTGVQ